MVQMTCFGGWTLPELETSDILINNAGILRDASFLKMTDKQWNDVYKVHLFGTFALTRAVWNHMRDQRYVLYGIYDEDSG